MQQCCGFHALSKPHTAGVTPTSLSAWSTFLSQQSQHLSLSCSVSFDSLCAPACLAAKRSPGPRGSSGTQRGRLITHSREQAIHTPADPDQLEEANRKMSQSPVLQVHSSGRSSAEFFWTLTDSPLPRLLPFLSHSVLWGSLSSK